jgi:hypothetical protein
MGPSGMVLFWEKEQEEMMAIARNRQVLNKKIFIVAFSDQDKTSALKYNKSG